MARFVNVGAWNCSDSEYFHGDAVGSSNICRALGFGGPSGKTGDMGNACHVAILRPGRFDQMVSTPPAEVQPGSGAGQKKRLADWKEAQGDRLVLTSSAYQTVKAMRDAMAVGRGAQLLAPLRADGVAVERSYKALDTVTGLTVRIRPDAFLPDAGKVWDLKMSKDPGYFAFRRAVVSCAYYVQLALYHDVLRDMLGRSIDWSWVVVGNSPPYLPGVYKATAEWVELGRRFYDAGLGSIANARRSGVEPIPWWSSKPIDMDPPPDFLSEEVAMHEQFADTGEVSREQTAPVVLTMGGKALAL